MKTSIKITYEARRLLNVVRGYFGTDQSQAIIKMSKEQLKKIEDGKGKDKKPS